MRDYQTQYEKLLTRAGKLTPAQQVGCFISGLKEEIRTEGQAARPASLSAAVGLARLYEAKQVTVLKISPPEKNMTQAMGTEVAETYSPIIRKFSPTEIEDRRKKGLCFHCDERSEPKHQCKRLFLMEVCYPNKEADRGGGSANNEAAKTNRMHPWGKG